MTPTDIKIALLRAGLRQTDLAEEFGCSAAHVHQVLMGKGRSQPLKRFLARKLKLPVGELFPTSRRAA